MLSDSTLCKDNRDIEAYHDIMIYHLPKQSNGDIYVELNWYKKDISRKRITYIPLNSTIPRFAAFNPA